MSKKRSMHLMPKIAVLFLFFVVIAFFINGQYLINQTKKHIEGNVSYAFKLREKQIIEHLKEGKDPALVRGAWVAYADSLPESGLREATYDTLMFSKYFDEIYLFRIKETNIWVDSVQYHLVLNRNIDDFASLKADVRNTLIPSFILLAGIVLIFSIFLSGVVFRPFYSIMRKMEDFKLGDKAEIKPVKTSTQEFARMQELFIAMVDRIEEDYRNLKEYTENMSHEIKTPLAIIRNKTERLIADERVLEAQAEVVKTIFDETNHLTRLGSTLNLLTKIENHEYRNTEKLFTKPFIENHIDSVSELAGLKDLQINAVLSETHYLMMDPFLFEIILKNLFRNAISYASKGTIIEIETTENSFGIRNAGPAPKVSPENIFKRFASGNQTKNSLGLGLALVKRICALNQLRIEYRYECGLHGFFIGRK
ncbi:HAMP domain-containing sensor histidine kinase [Persicobacter sp. CCB-QB2]|uniref:sensor histidine kinase n=1 Tax=Persicobacter sp. CCB-QB2 TaxID=1561025 RepID=UPI0006A9E09C|nr:HAMP domain-containing sensor histidine kinase [Persicobacter sp. CCB-QB2]